MQLSFCSRWANGPSLRRRLQSIVLKAEAGNAENRALLAKSAKIRTPS